MIEESEQCAMPDNVLGHPKGLVVCFLTELWERFAYYGMLSLLILFLTKEYRLSDEIGNTVVAAYGALVWMMPVVGGVIADRFLGSRKAVIFGASLMAFGLVSISFPSLHSWFLPTAGGAASLDVIFFSLAIVITGVGFFKPNITTIVGSLYEQNDPRREIGFTVFYMSINAGGFLGAVICGGLSEWLGMRYGFSAAGVAMLLAIVIFLYGQKHIGDRTNPPNPATLKKTLAPGFSVETLLYLGGLGLIVVLWQALRFYAVVSGMLLWFAAALGAFLIYFAFFRCDPKERDRMLAVLILVSFVVVFWALSMQIFSSLVLFSDRLVDRQIYGAEIAASQLQGLPGLIMIAMTPVVGYLWIWLERRRKNPNVPAKFAIALIFAGVAFTMPAIGVHFSENPLQVPLPWFLMIYLLMVTGELCQAPIALDLITRLSPKRIVAMMVGAGFVSIAFGSLISGLLAARYTVVAQNADGSLADPAAAMEIYTSAYSMFGFGAMCFGVVLYVLSPFILRLMHEHDAVNDASMISSVYRKIGFANV